jgi:FMN-dependent NADH-azoreductase
VTRLDILRHLQTIFETIGIPSVVFVGLEGTARGPAAVTRAA